MTTQTISGSRPVHVSGGRSKLAKRLLLIGGGAVVIAGGAAAWVILHKPALPAGFAGGNGRLEAKQVYIAAKYPGRISEVLFDEGDTVEAGQIVARLDTSALQAQLRQELANIREAEEAKRVAQTGVAVKQADYNLAARQYQRTRGLVPKGAVSEQEAEIDNARMLSSRAELAGSRAEVVKSDSSIEAARATADRIRAEIADAVLVAPLRSRVEGRLAEPGEVVGQGGRVLSLVDLSDVYMYVFVPEKVAGKLPLGSEARIVLDAAPQYPVRAFVSFVSPVSQFTPKTVETAEERHNLTFRVKLQIPKERLRQYEPLVKTGVPGMGYVRFDKSAAWPEKLQAKASIPPNLWASTGRAGAQ